MLIRLTCNEIKRILCSAGFWLSVGLALILHLTVSIYTDIDGSVYTVVSAVSEFSREEMISKRIYAQETFSASVMQTLSMYGTLLAALSFAGAFCEEQKYGVRRYLLFKEGKVKYVLSKVLAAITSSGLSFLLAAVLLLLFIYGKYPLWTEADADGYVYWLEFYSKEMGCFSVFFDWIGEYADSILYIAGVCVYGVFCGFIGYLCTAFFSNVYLSVCIPFFFGYIYYSIIAALTGRLIEGTLSWELYNAIMTYVSPYGYMEFWKKQDGRLVNMAVLLAVWLIAAGIHILRIRKAADCGVNDASASLPQWTWTKGISRVTRSIYQNKWKDSSSIEAGGLISKIKGIFRVALAEYKRWLYNPRILMLFMLIIYAREAVGKVLCEHAEAMGQPLHWLEPYLALNNSVVAILIMPVFFLVLMSDFPVMEGSYLWAIYRTGKVKWIITQLLFAFFAILTIMGGLFVSSIFSCWGNLTVEGSWSNVVTRYYLAFPEDAFSPTAQLIQGDIYNQLEVGEAMLLSVTLTILMLLLYCTILLCGKIYGRKYLPLGICIGLMGLGAALSLLETKLAFLFPPAHALLSGHMHEYLRKPIVPYWASYLYLCVALVLVLILAVIGVKRRDVCKRL